MLTSGNLLFYFLLAEILVFIGELKEVFRMEMCSLSTISLSISTHCVTQTLKIRITNIFEDTGDTVAFNLGDVVVILEQRAKRVDDNVVV